MQTAGSEIKRRLGMAKRDFDALSRVWNHSTLTLRQEIQIFAPCIASLVPLAVCGVVGKSERRKINAFHICCEFVVPRSCGGAGGQARYAVKAVLLLELR